MNLSLILSIFLMFSIWSFAGYAFIQIKYPGRGVKMIENIFKETISFEEAIKALKEGNRIRRKSERKGYTKVIVTEGKHKRERYGTYWVSDEDAILDYCSFSLEDVISNDWIIDNP